jgi:hypothetical protein
MVIDLVVSLLGNLVVNVWIDLIGLHNDVHLMIIWSKGVSFLVDIRII